MGQGLQDQVAFDIAKPHADKSGGVVVAVDPCSGGALKGDGILIDGVTWRQQHRPMDAVFQLADIASPGVVFQNTMRIRSQSAIRQAVKFGKFTGEMICEGADVVPPVPKGRQMQADHIEAK